MTDDTLIEWLLDSDPALRCQPDGTWLQERRHPGRVWFEVDVDVGERSKWLTFFGVRVLQWWDTA